MLTPVFLIGFPLLGVPRLTTVAAIGTSLLLETSGFGTGVARYLAMRLADLKTARSIIAVTLPLGALGAIAARHTPTQALRIGYGVAMLGLAWLLARKPPGRPADQEAPRPALVSQSDRSHPPCGHGQVRAIRAADGRTYAWCAHGLRGQRAISGAGALVAGLISTGVGEATLPPLVRRSRFPVAVAAATSTLIVAGTVTGAAATHLVHLVATGGLAAIPWNLLVWAVPGAVAGAMLGTRLQAIGITSIGQAAGWDLVIGAAHGMVVLVALPMLLALMHPLVRAGRLERPGVALVGYGAAGRTTGRSRRRGGPVAMPTPATWPARKLSLGVAAAGRGWCRGAPDRLSPTTACGSSRQRTLRATPDTARKTGRRLAPMR